MCRDIDLHHIKRVFPIMIQFRLLYDRNFQLARWLSCKGMRFRHGCDWVGVQTASWPLNVVLAKATNSTPKCVKNKQKNQFSSSGNKFHSSELLMLKRSHPAKSYLFGDVRGRQPHSNHHSYSSSSSSQEFWC